MDSKYFLIAFLIAFIFTIIKIFYYKFFEREQRLSIKHILKETFFVSISSFIGIFVLFEYHHHLLFTNEHKSPLVFTDDPYL